MLHVVTKPEIPSPPISPWKRDMLLRTSSCASYRNCVTPPFVAAFVVGAEECFLATKEVACTSAASTSAPRTSGPYTYVLLCHGYVPSPLYVVDIPEQHPIFASLTFNLSMSRSNRDPQSRPRHLLCTRPAIKRLPNGRGTSFCYRRLRQR
ncbi:hypothetical protein PsYK624_168560 [Phanerochaete sordida]|uniref:Uncharacterized protein n=1 Tax=Phanerochaete sordida TaxID=48140 RepID=A0A9P3GRK0_9APHY|nr:hypothetical protein PsYK624_168560 [Phanerochaete sordida]